MKIQIIKSKRMLQCKNYKQSIKNGHSKRENYELVVFKIMGIVSAKAQRRRSVLQYVTW